jgi:hypothetical protein
MKTLATLALCLLPTIAAAQAPAPGWIPTGEWQCGPHVRVIVSIDGYGAMNFNVIGAWFDNNYTVRRGALFYNGVACAAVGNVWPPQPPPRRSKRVIPDDEIPEPPDVAAPAPSVSTTR